MARTKKLGMVRRGDVDLETLQQLHADVREDVDITCGILGSYRTRSQEMVRELEAAANTQDVDRLRSVAHNLGSISALVGAVGIHEIAVTLECEELSDAQASDLTAEAARRLPNVLDIFCAFAADL